MLSNMGFDAPEGMIYAQKDHAQYHNLEKHTMHLGKISIGFMGEDGGNIKVFVAIAGD
jgi:hypothetical protein